jgi:hypothetical protein
VACLYVAKRRNPALARATKIRHDGGPFVRWRRGALAKVLYTP